jgi:predicted enzyme related to lactoylglutathione lyase
MIGRLDEVVVDCHDPLRLAEFWHAVLGGELQRQSAEWVAVHPPTGITVGFQLVPEGKVVKNRVHLDVRVGDDSGTDVDSLERAAAEAEALGATRHGGPMLDEMGGFQVMRDPEGNEFCFILGPTPIDPTLD